jgi:hypothetical protein
VASSSPELAALLATMRELMHGDDGSLPDVFIDFGRETKVAQAYAQVQSCAAPTSRVLGHFWCEARGRDFDIHYGENPAEMLLIGDADPFHVCYETLRAPNGAQLTEIGMFVETPTLVSLNYRRGENWTDPAIFGFFSLIESVAALANGAKVTHAINLDDPDGTRFVEAFLHWQALGRPSLP